LHPIRHTLFTGMSTQGMVPEEGLGMALDKAWGVVSGGKWHKALVVVLVEPLGELLEALLE